MIAIMFWRLTTRIPKYVLVSNSRRLSQVQFKTQGKSYNIKSSDEIEGFLVESINEVPDFQCKAICLKHVSTGAKYLHIDRNDSNNVFGISFRTTPFDSTGLPHILEHITLCGSRLYPCRDPFFKMLNRSLATYMNAMTGPDFTVYPFATQNKTDYYNLMSVYLDAVFKPQLREFDFKQEGWRLEHEDIYDSNSKIIFKGVVFNEMKGVFSENYSIFMESVLNNILPSHTYGVISGGDPLIIPKLNYNDLVKFHRDHYHPSNSRIYSYGNFDLHNHLKFINESYLRHFDNTDISDSTKVPLEPRWNKPRSKHISGKFDPLAQDQDKQSYISVSYLCEDIRNNSNNFSLRVLSELLVEGPNSSFYKSLIEKNIGSGFSPLTGFEGQTRDTFFSVGLQGVSSDNFEYVESLINRTIDKTIKKGFEQKNIDNILHGIELSVKHQGSKFGLSLLLNITSLWNHDVDIVESMNITKHIKNFRNNIQNNKNYLQEMIEKYLKSNNHKLTLLMAPDKELEEKNDKAESELLNQKLSLLSDKDKKDIYQNGLFLRQEQEKTEDTSCLPTLKISDINKDIEKTKLNHITEDGVPIQICEAPTNGVSYLRVLTSTSHLPTDLKELLPLFAQVVCSMGTSEHDYRTFDQNVLMTTGGLSVAAHVSDGLNSWKYNEGLCFSSHCLDRNVKSMLKLWDEIFNKVTLTDLNRFTTLTKILAGDLVNGIADSGHHYAMLSASSSVDTACFRKEQLAGLTNVLKIKEIAQMNDLTGILSKMKEISERILSKKYMKYAINSTNDNSREAISEIRKLISGLSDKLHESNNEEMLNNKNGKCTHYVLPYTVNFTAKSIPTVPFTDPHYAPLRVLCKLLTTKYLLPIVREKYGAYGTGANLSPSGVIQFYSYRDPNSISTLDIFDSALEWVSKTDILEEHIDEAKLGVFQIIDEPVAPCSKGQREFMYGITDEILQKHRIDCINVNKESILNVAKLYLGSEVSGKALIGPDNKQTENWIRIL